MRILTIGVIIVTVGTLAALPFRRPTPPQSEQVAPIQATGPQFASRTEVLKPTQPSGEIGLPSPLAFAEDGSVSRAEIGRIDFGWHQHPSDEFAAHQPPPSAVRRQGQNAEAFASYAPKPLTYEDLAIPIDGADTQQQPPVELPSLARDWSHPERTSRFHPLTLNTAAGSDHQPLRQTHDRNSLATQSGEAARHDGALSLESSSNAITQSVGFAPTETLSPEEPLLPPPSAMENPVAHPGESLRPKFWIRQPG